MAELTDGNRKLALNALVKRDAAGELIKAVERGKISKEVFSETHRAELLKHPRAVVREQAKEMFN